MAIPGIYKFTPCCEGDNLNFAVGTSEWENNISGVWKYAPDPQVPENAICYTIEFVPSIELAPSAPSDEQMEFVAETCEEAAQLDSICNCTPCYTLTDCAGILEPINTQTDLSSYVGTVITLADDTNHEIDVCRLVEVGEFCFDIVDVVVYKCHDTCEDCLPTPLPPQLPCPRPVNPGYDTGLCDPHIVEEVNCSYSDLMYEKMMARRFAIDFCCSKDEAALFIKYEKIRLKLLTSKNPTPDPCNPECLNYGIDISIGDSSVTTYLNCDGEEVEEIQESGRVIIGLRFCALNTNPPVSVITHQDESTDTYILEPMGDCSIVPPVPPAEDRCLVNTVTIPAGVGDNRSFTYTDCNGARITLNVQDSKGDQKFDICILETPNYVFTNIVGQTILQSEEECLPPLELPCSIYQIQSGAGNNGSNSMDYIDCQGNAQNRILIGFETFELCGIPGQTLSCNGACKGFQSIEIENACG